MRQFWKDYGHLCKETGKFYKKHWFGVIVMNAVTYAAMVAYIERDEIKDKLEEVFHKNNEGEA